MIAEYNIETIRDVKLKNKRIIIRVDFDVPLGVHEDIIDDVRIMRNIPTIARLADNGNRIILIAKLGRPKGRDKHLSLKPIVMKLPKYLPGYSYRLVEDFLTEELKTFENQSPQEIIVLENIRYYEEEENPKPAFVKKLSELGDVYVNDAFAMSHRSDSSVVGLPHHMIGYAGLLLEEEITSLLHVIHKPKRPVVTILGGAKVSSKLSLISKLLEISDHVLLGGAIANTFLEAKGFNIGLSLYEKACVPEAKRLLEKAHTIPVQFALPVDVVVSDTIDRAAIPKLRQLSAMSNKDHIMDIGPTTADIYTRIIQEAGTIIWNGPMGLFERPEFRGGTNAMYKAITHHPKAYAVVGGGDTLAALTHKKHLDRIDHVSTGGGAMLEFIEKGTLPGLEALQYSQKHFSK